MGAFNWIATIGSHVGSDGTQKLFKGAWNVTVGDFIQGIYGTCLQSYYGPYITHVVDAAAGGLGGLVGTYLNDANALTSLFGINGYVTWIYGPNITVNYGGPVAVIQRATVYNKTGLRGDVKDPTKGIPVPLNFVNAYKPSGAPPNGVDAETLAAADEDTLVMVNLLSWLMNITIATLELAVKFKYSDFDPTKDGQPVAASNIDTTMSIMVPAMMGLIYAIEKAGGWESYQTAVKAKAKEYLKDVVKVVTYPFTKHQKSKTKEASQATKDALAMTMLLIDALLLIIGLAAMAGAI